MVNGEDVVLKAIVIGEVRRGFNLPGYGVELANQHRKGTGIEVAIKRSLELMPHVQKRGLLQKHPAKGPHNMPELVEARISKGVAL